MLPPQNRSTLRSRRAEIETAAQQADSRERLRQRGQSAVIAVDTNVLIYAHCSDVQWHLPAKAALKRLTELWTADRDFSRFPQLKTHNPLVVV